MPRLPKANFVSHSSLNRLGSNPASVTKVFGRMRGLLLRGSDSIRGCAPTDSPTDDIPQERAGGTLGNPSTGRTDARSAGTAGSAGIPSTPSTASDGVRFLVQISPRSE